MKPDFVTLHLVHPSIPGDAAMLTDEETSRAEKFRFPEDAVRWISYRSSLRRILGAVLGTSPREVPIHLSESGKPCLAPPFENIHFSLSHVDALALIAISHDGPVGIDVESKARARDLLGCEPSFCHPDELLELPVPSDARSEKLLELWTMKEAALKSLGTGFLTPPETVRILALESNLHRAIDEGSNAELVRQHIQPISHSALNGYQVALSSRQRAWKLVPCGESTTHVQSATIRPSDG